LAWLDQIPAIDSRIRTVHLIEYRTGQYTVAAHSGREDLADFYGTEERIHQFLTIAPAIIIGASGTVQDVVGKAEMISVVYEKVVVAYVPAGENIIAVSIAHDAEDHVPEIAKKIREFVRKHVE
jgi:hypothetical protein